MAKRTKTEGSFSELLFDNSISSEGLSTVRLSDIEPNKNQPRKSFDEESLKELADSINEHGIIQPLIVQSTPTGGYRIIAGERRWRAAKMAGLAEVPVVVRDDITEEQTMQIALIENLQRENLNPIEEALGYKELIDRYKMTQERLAKALGKARSSIANSLGLLTLPNGVQELLKSGHLDAGHCKALKKVKDPARMTELARMTADGKLSVRDVEVLAKREEENNEEGTKKEVKQRPPYYTEVEASLSSQLGLKVKIIEGRSFNTLQIQFGDDNQLRMITQYFNESE